MALPRSYQPVLAFADPARPRAEIWRTVLGVLLIVGFFLVSEVVITLTVLDQYGRVFGSVIMARMITGGTPGLMIFYLLNVVPLGIGAILVVRMLHARRAGTLFGPDPARVLRDLFRVAGWTLLPAVLLLPLDALSGGMQPNLPLERHLLYLPVALLAILAQISSEEILFRGYLLQQVAARSRARIWWIGLPSALFAALHFSPALFGASAYVYALWAFCFGCFASDLTARTGSLGGALGMHLGTNLPIMLLFGREGYLDGLALWTTVDTGSDIWMTALNFLLLFVNWLIARLVLGV